MVSAGLLLAALQAATVAPAVPNCALVTPRGDDIHFFIWSAEGDDDIRLSPLASATWPRSTVVGVRRPTERGLRFDIGSRDGFVLELNAQVSEAQRTATLLRRDGHRATIPVAYGYCQDGPVTVEPSDPGDQTAVGANDPAFDPTLWPEYDCALLLDNGRHTRITFDLPRPDMVRLQSADLWSGRPVTTTIRWSRLGNQQIGLFSQRGGFGGIQTMIIDGDRAVKLLRLSQLGEGSPPDMNGYGICGYRHIERRPGPA